jgi:hypothetical protein
MPMSRQNSGITEWTNITSKSCKEYWSIIQPTKKNPHKHTIKQLARIKLVRERK